MTARRTDVFCTLFDRNYLFVGLALHRSLLRHAGTFRLYVLAMDELTERVVTALRLEHVIVVPLAAVVSPELVQARERMSLGQLCWNCQPLLCRYVLDRDGDADAVTYLEADSYFFDSPQVLLTEIGAGSVSLVPHHYLPRYDQTEESGVYCVQFNLFRDDACAREVLDSWIAACLRYDRRHPRDFPGQKCMDDWPKRWPCVHVVQHIGAGVAPWNVSRYRIGLRDGHPTVDGRNVVFYHFQDLSFMDQGGFFMTSYALPPGAVEHVYRPYLEEVLDVVRQVHRTFPDFDHAKRFQSPGFLRAVRSGNPELLRDWLKFVFRTVVRRKSMIRLPVPT